VKAKILGCSLYPACSAGYSLAVKLATEAAFNPIADFACEIRLVVSTEFLLGQSGYNVVLTNVRGKRCPLR
jgi:hypothetical protein